MNQLFVHIEYLLHTHHCVIVPNLGGFVLNRIAATRDGVSVFNAPHWELIFNRSLTYNDGLLAESFMKTDNISFEVASEKIDNAVEEFKQQIRKSNTLDIEQIGLFHLGSGGAISLSPHVFARPDLFGLDSVKLKPMIQLHTKKRTSEKNSDSSNVNRGIGAKLALVAAVAALFFLLVPMKDNSDALQKTHVTSESSFVAAHAVKPKSILPVIDEKTSEKRTNVVALKEPEQKKAPVVNSTRKKYDIILGVFKMDDDAGQLISILEEEGFSHIYTFMRHKRIHVSVGAYTDKSEALQNLQEIRRNFSNHKDAWLLKK